MSVKEYGPGWKPAPFQDYQDRQHMKRLKWLCIGIAIGMGVMGAIGGFVMHEMLR